MNVDFWIAVLAGGFALLGTGVGSILALLTTASNRRASVRDQAYKESVEACAEFIAVSHLLLGREWDLISALARVKKKYPDDEYLGDRIDNGTLLEIIHPLMERFYDVATRAEMLAPTPQAAEYVHEMAALYAVVGEFVRDGHNGQLAKDWQAKVTWYVEQHDEISKKLIEHMRDVGAKTSYRQAVSRNASKSVSAQAGRGEKFPVAPPVDAPEPDVQH